MRRLDSAQSIQSLRPRTRSATALFARALELDAVTASSSLLARPGRGGKRCAIAIQRLRPLNQPGPFVGLTDLAGPVLLGLGRYAESASRYRIALDAGTPISRQPG